MGYRSEITGEDLDFRGDFKVKLASVGNPDRNQHPFQGLIGVPFRVMAVKTLREACFVCRCYIEEHGLGGGNWSGGEVSVGDEIVARVSYNGRVWQAIEMEQETHVSELRQRI